MSRAPRLPIAAALLCLWAAAAQAATGTGEMAVSARVDPLCTARTESLSADGQGSVVLECSSEAGTEPAFALGAGAAALPGLVRTEASGATYLGSFDWTPSEGGAVPVVTITYGGIEGP